MTCVSLHLRSIQFDAIWIYLQDFTPCFFQWRPLKLLHALFCFTEYTGVKYLNATKILKTNDWNPEVDNERIFLSRVACWIQASNIPGKTSEFHWLRDVFCQTNTKLGCKIWVPSLFFRGWGPKNASSNEVQPEGWNYNPTRTRFVHFHTVSTFMRYTIMLWLFAIYSVHMANE